MVDWVYWEFDWEFGREFDSTAPPHAVPILDFWGPYTKLCQRQGVGGGMYERMDETHLSLFHSVLNHAHGKHSRNNISSVARYTFD